MNDDVVDDEDLDWLCQSADADMASPLRRTDSLEPLLSYDRMQATVNAWLIERRDELFGIVTTEADHPGRISPQREKEILDSADALLGRVAAWWPVQYGSRRLGLVIKQWVEGEPNEVLAMQLSKDPGWNEEVSLRNQTYQQWQEAMRDMTPDAWINGRGWYRNDDQGAERWLSGRLRRRGLPSTPSTVRHLRAVAAGRNQPLPGRGLLVTTLAFVNPRHDEQNAPQTLPHYFTPPHEFLLLGSSEWTTKALIEEGYAVMREHRAFLHRFRDYPIADVTTYRQLQSLHRRGEETNGPEWLDYEAAAMLAIDREEFDRERGRSDPQHAATVFLNGIQRRVKGRGGGKAPASWRDRPRARLMEMMGIAITAHKHPKDL
jgi:hypothetical protein